MYPKFEELTNIELQALKNLLDDFINEERRQQFCFLIEENITRLKRHRLVEIAPPHNASYYRLTQQGAIYAASVLSDYDKDKFFDRFNEVFKI